MVDRSFRSISVALLAFVVGLSGCASGGGSGSADGGVDVDALMAEARDIEQGESPRDTPNTDAAADALDDAEAADESAEARGHLQRALESAEAAIAEDPRNPLAHRYAALANLFLENFQDAGAHFGHAEELRPIYQFEDVALREQAYIDQYQAASPLLNEAAYVEAAVYLENASAVYANRPEANVTLAQIYSSLRRHDTALAKIDEVMAFLSSDVMDDIEEATAANWRASAEGFPLMKAQVLADAGRFEESAVAYRGLVAADPQDADVQQDLGAILMQMGETQEALQVFGNLMTLPGMNSDGLSRIGLGFYQADQFGEAATALQRAAEVSPNDRDALEWWARALMADSAFTEIPPVVERWIALDPQSRQALAILAQATNVNGDTQAAAGAIQRVQALEFSVDNLQMRRTEGVGADVSGGVSNASLEAGAQVTLVFTFYAESGNPLGTVVHTVAVGAEGMSEVFQLQFDTAETVGGYGYVVGG
jgi:tetratricopeptide (TPR) repeat protein